jgi:hypothetical protein
MQTSGGALLVLACRHWLRCGGGRSLFLLAALLISAPACQLFGGEAGCVPGTALCDCTSSGECDQGLVCMTTRPPKRTCYVPFEGGSGPGAGGAAPAPGAPSGSGGSVGGVMGDRLVGLWRGLGPGRGYMGYILFSDDGRFFADKPLWRVDGSFDFEASAQRDPREVGRQRVVGGQLVMTWNASGNERRYALRTGAGGLPEFDYADPFKPAVPCAPGTSFEGTFGWSRSISTGAPPAPLPGMTTVGASVSNSTTLRLMAGRRFAYESSVAVSTVGTGQTTGGTHVTTVDGDGETMRGEGTFEIRGLFMELRFDSGKVVQDVMQCFDPKGDSFVLGYRMFFRR